MNKQSKDQKQEKKKQTRNLYKNMSNPSSKLNIKILIKNITNIYKQRIKKRHIKIFNYHINNK